MTVIENLTESEEIVMKAVWDCRNEPGFQDVLEVVTTVYGKDWRSQTVPTFLAKLVRKGYLKLKRNGKIYTYKVVVKEDAYKRKLYRQHVSFWNHNDMAEFIAEMLNNNDITQEELEKIAEMNR